MTLATQTSPALISSTSHSTAVSSNNLRFVYIKKDSNNWDIVKKVFQETFEPLYGNRELALQKIVDRKRKCELLLDFDKNISLGIIVYKTKNKNFVIKSLHNLHPEKQGNTADLLLNRILKLAIRASSQSVLCKVSSKDSELLRFLTSRHFTILKSSNNKFLPGIKNYTLSRTLPAQPSSNINKETSYEKERTDTSSHKRKRNSEESDSHYLSSSHYDSSKKQREDYPTPQYRRYVMDQQTRPSSTQRLTTSFQISKNFHQITLKRKYILQIRNEEKTIEGRINSGVFLGYKIGDKIRFFYQQNQSDDVICQIEAIRKYPSFAEMLQAEGYKKCIADAYSLESAIKIYDQIPGYSERAAKFGVIAIQIKVCKRRLTI